MMNRLSVLWRKISSYSLVYLQSEALPYLPFEFERHLFAAGPPVVVDYDDAIYTNYALISNRLLQRLLGSKIPSVIRHSAHVIVANQTLADWAHKFNSNISVIPTSVDLRKYPFTQTPKPTECSSYIGWIGSPITVRYLQLLETPLRILHSRHNFSLKVIGAPDLRMEGISIIHVPWSESTEANELRTCVAGVMPLPDLPWERGKSALKLIQYLAAGIVGVASPVGTNCDVVQDGENGFLATSDKEWVEKLSLVLENPLLRHKLGIAGRRTVESKYSVQANAPKWIDVLRSIATL